MEEFTPISNDRGLYKKVLKQGNGDFPLDGSLVTITYTGILEDGTVFDESTEEGFEFKIEPNDALTGLVNGVKTMRKGEKAILVMRADYAYGSEGYLAIPPNATLIFCVDLLDFFKRK